LGYARVSTREQPAFYYDLSSPYSYLAAERVNQLFAEASAEPPEWKPISFGFLLQAVGRVPWSLQLGKERDMAEIESRAAERGLPPVRWPEFWHEEPGDDPTKAPVARNYSLAAARAATFAKQSGRAVAFSLAAFRQAFAGGRDLSDVDNILLAAAACELHPKAVLKGIETQSVKEALKAATGEAIGRGVTGIPTVAVGEQLFWGDDRLEEAAEAAAAIAAG
jgi:2-hydroxychromene-2-carboxylate isomerase